MSAENGVKGRVSQRECIALVAQTAPEHAVPIGIYVWQVTNGIISLNPGFESLIGQDLRNIQTSPLKLSQELNDLQGRVDVNDRNPEF